MAKGNKSQVKTTLTPKQFFSSYDQKGKLYQSLLEIGLSSRDSKVFICLCSLGSQPGSTIAKNLDMKRTTIYHSLQRLADRGLVFPHREGRTTYFHINPIEKAISKVEQQREELNQQKANLSEIALQIKNHTSVAKNSERFRFREHYGLPELQRLKLSTVTKKAEIRIFSAVTKDGYLPSLKNISAIKKYQSAVQANNAQVRILIPEGANSTALTKRLHSRQIAIRTIPKYRFPSNNNLEINILPQSMVIFSEQSGATIENKQMVHLQSSTFDLAWAGIESTKCTPSKKQFII